MSLSTVGLLAAAAAVGALVPLQAGLNATLAGHGGHALFAALVNFVLASVVLAAAAAALRVALPIARAAAEAPWYAWTGGLCGATLVLGTIVLAPRLGASGFVCAMIVGTVAVSLLVDHFGLLVFRPQPVSLLRLVGAALVVLGMVLVNRF